MNTEKKVIVCGPEPDSAKTILLGMLEYCLLEENCFPGEVENVGGTHTTSNWTGKRMISFAEAEFVDDRGLAIFVSKVAARVGGDRAADEPKYAKQIATRPEQWFWINGRTNPLKLCFKEKRV